MRTANLVLLLACGPAVLVAAAVAWRGRLRPTLGAVRETSSAFASARDALRRVACVLTAALFAGTLAVGLGGRLVMRVLGATSGDVAQGRLTEADETVGDITFGGSFFFIVFAGILIPLFVALLFLLLHRTLPGRAWAAGLMFGVILLGTVGVSDPLAPDNRDFDLLAPRWLAVLLVTMVALLFGTAFVAAASWLDARTKVLPGSKLVHLSLLWLVLPFYLAPAAVYVVARAASRGRVWDRVEGTFVPRAGQIAVSVLGLVAVGLVVRAATDII